MSKRETFQKASAGEPPSASTKRTGNTLEEGMQQPRKTVHSAEIERLQERIADLVVENDTLQQKLTSSTFNTNDVIGYLKGAVEDKDGEIARLEDGTQRLRKEGENAIKSERERHMAIEESLRNEIEMAHSEIRIMNTQLGNQHRMQLEMGEMAEKMTAMRRRLDDQDEQLKRKAADESTVKVLAENKIRAELTVLFGKQLKVLRDEYNLQKEGELIMNQKMIERLEAEIISKKAEIDRARQDLEEAKAKIDEGVKAKEEADVDNTKLRQLLEKSSILTEKALKDTKRRLEESEKKRTATLTQYNDVVASFRTENTELAEQLKKADGRVDEVEELLSKEKDARDSTVRAHATQNERLAELKKFLDLALYPGDSSNDDLLAENEHALFARLAIILGQIPIVK